MTCVVGVLEADGSVWLGADSLASAGYSGMERADRKIGRLASGHIYGVAGSPRVRQIITHAVKLPAV